MIRASIGGYLLAVNAGGVICLLCVTVTGCLVCPLGIGFACQCIDKGELIAGV